MTYDKEYRRNNYLKNKERDNSQAVEWSRKNRDRVNQKKRERYWKDPEAARAKARAESQKYKEQIAAKRKDIRAGKSAPRLEARRRREIARAAGEVFYDSGIVCSKGHGTKRRVKSNNCPYCASERWKKWRDVNRERYLAGEASYRELKRQKISDGKKDWYERNRESALAHNTEYREKNRELINSRRKEQKKEDPEKFRVWGRASRTRRKGAKGTHKSSDIAEIMQAQNGRCAYCKVKLGKKVERHVDHIVPLSRGGTNDRRNLQMLCRPCNQKKYAKDPIDFARSLGKLL